MVVRTKNSCRGGAGSLPLGGQFYFPIFVTKLVCGNDGGEYEVMYRGRQLSFIEYGNGGSGKVWLVCASRLLGMGDDSLLIQKRGGWRCG